MSGIATAIAGTAVLGAVTSAKAAKSASASSAAQTAVASETAAAQNEASMAQLEFQKQQYADWENIFGPIQNNLSSYYQNLHPDTFASLGIQNIEKQYATSRQNLDVALAKRGIENSGATVAGLTQLESARMLGKAEAQTNAPMQVAQLQQGFLATGLGTQSNLQSGISNAYSNQMNVLGQQSSNALNQAGNYAQQAAAGYAGIGSSIGAGINTYMTYGAYQNQQALNTALTNKLSTVG